MQRARRLIYLEDQYLWAAHVADLLAEALARNPQLHLIAVVSRYPEQNGRLSGPPARIGQQQALDRVRGAGGDRVAVYNVENDAGSPIYVHAKVCIIDDVWASVGSDNMALRSWTHDSELSCAVIDAERDERLPLTRAVSATAPGSSPGSYGCGSGPSISVTTRPTQSWSARSRASASGATRPLSWSAGTATAAAVPARTAAR